MLILQRARGESIIIDGRIRVTLVDILSGNRARIGIEAPREISVHREEIQRKVDGGKEDIKDDPKDAGTGG